MVVKMEVVVKMEDRDLVKSNTCEECGSTFKKPGYLKQHMHSHSLEQLPPLHPSAAGSSTALIPPPTLNHPPSYAEMIYAAITTLQEKGGSSKIAIGKHIEQTYSNLPANHSTLLTEQLHQLKNTGHLRMVKKSYKLPRPKTSRGCEPNAAVLKSRRPVGRPRKQLPPLHPSAVASPAAPVAPLALNHPPPYAEMIYAAITTLKEKGGSSKIAIGKHIVQNYSNLPANHSTLLTENLHQLKNTGHLRMVKKSYKLPRPKTSRGCEPNAAVPVRKSKRPVGRPRKDEFESLCLETQVGAALDTVEQLVEEQGLDPLLSEKTNIMDVKCDISTAKKNEIQYLTGMLERVEEQKRLMQARIELLKRGKQDVSGMVDVVEKAGYHGFRKIANSAAT